MDKDFEINVVCYGESMFRIMLEKDSGIPHWESIRAKAEPLVRELIRLNDEMVGGGYKIYGYEDKNNKKKLSNWERIALAQKQLWGVEAGTLVEDDLCWPIGDYDFEFHLEHQRPCTVEYKKSTYLGVDSYDYERIIQVGNDQIVLKAPADWENNEDLYTSEEYWLEQADKLGL